MKYVGLFLAGAALGSRPVRALWIEMFLPHSTDKELFVEAREGLVD